MCFIHYHVLLIVSTLVTVAKNDFLLSLKCNLEPFLKLMVLDLIGRCLFQMVWIENSRIHSKCIEIHGVPSIAQTQLNQRLKDTQWSHFDIFQLWSIKYIWPLTLVQTVAYTFRIWGFKMCALWGFLLHMDILLNTSNVLTAMQKMWHWPDHQFISISTSSSHDLTSNLLQFNGIWHVIQNGGHWSIA